MITHTSGSHQILNQNKTKSKLQVLKIAKNSNFEILHVTHLLKLLDKLYKYEMDPTRTVGATELIRDGRTDVLEKNTIYCDENRRRFFCLLRIIQESGVYQLGVPEGQGDSSAPSTTDPLICGFCLVTTPNTRGTTVVLNSQLWHGCLRENS